MKIISHRGNLEGPSLDTENSPAQIEKCIELGFECEVDLRIHNGEPYLGHYNAQYPVTIDWLLSKSNVLWIHCKDSESLSFLKKEGQNLNYFWHENDTITLTSKNYIWAYPGKQPIMGSIAVMQELNNLPLFHNSDNMIDIGDYKCYGICSDYVGRMK